MTSETALSAQEPRTESGRLLLQQEGILPLFIGAASEPGDHFLRDFIIAIEQEAARSQPATEGLREAARAVRDNAVAGWQPMDNDFVRFYRLLADLSAALAATEPADTGEPET